MLSLPKVVREQPAHSSPLTAQSQTDSRDRQASEQAKRLRQRYLGRFSILPSSLPPSRRGSFERRRGVTVSQPAARSPPVRPPSAHSQTTGDARGETNHRRTELYGPPGLTRSRSLVAPPRPRSRSSAGIALTFFLEETVSNIEARRNREEEELRSREATEQHMEGGRDAVRHRRRG